MKTVLQSLRNKLASFALNRPFLFNITCFICGYITVSAILSFI